MPSLISEIVGQNRVLVSPVYPTSPKNGDMWFETDPATGIQIVQWTRIGNYWMSLEKTISFSHIQKNLDFISICSIDTKGYDVMLTKWSNVFTIDDLTLPEMLDDKKYWDFKLMTTDGTVIGAFDTSSVLALTPLVINLGSVHTTPNLVFYVDCRRIKGVRELTYSYSLDYRLVRKEE